jgi:hypothetical protein
LNGNFLGHELLLLDCLPKTHYSKHIQYFIQLSTDRQSKKGQIIAYTRIFKSHIQCLLNSRKEDDGLFGHCIDQFQNFFALLQRSQQFVFAVRTQLFAQLRNRERELEIFENSGRLRVFAKLVDCGARGVHDCLVFSMLIHITDQNFQQLLDLLINVFLTRRAIL